MKKLLILFCVALLVFVGYLALNSPDSENVQVIQTELEVPVILVQADLPVEVGEEASLLDKIKSYWEFIVGAGALTAILLLAETIVNLTPTDKDNSILKKIKKWLDLLVPNRKTGGGTFEEEPQ